MEKRRTVIRTPAFALIAAVLLCMSPPCCSAESSGHDGGSTYVILGATMDFDLRAGFGYRWPAGLGVEAAIGCSLFSFEGALLLTGEALGVLPLFTLGRSGSLELLLGVPDILWLPGIPSFMASLGGAARLRFALGSRWSLLIRAGVGYPLFYAPEGAVSPSTVFFGMWPDLGIGAAFQL